MIAPDGLRPIRRGDEGIEDIEVGFRLAVEYRLLDLIERHDDVIEVLLVELQRQVRGGEGSWNRNLATLDRRRAAGPGDDNWAYLSTRCA